MNGIILFLKNYNLVKVKTRLAKDTSEYFAKNFYISCINNILYTLEKTSIPYYLFWYPEPIKNFKKDKKHFSQQGKDLGEKMFFALKKILNEEANKAIIIGSDIPLISKNIIQQAFNLLTKYDYVIGPCYDGGYYLIGTKKEKLNFEIFKNINWSTDKVLSQTIKKLKEENFSYYFLEKLYDIDNLSDLEIFLKFKNK